jgi:hypothetical protein
LVDGDNGIIRLGVGAASRRMPDGEYGGRYSVFTTTLLHEVSHAIYQGWLSDEQRAMVIDEYLNRLIRLGPRAGEEPTTVEAEHFFVDLVTGVLLRVDTRSASLSEARVLLRELGVPLAPVR